MTSTIDVRRRRRALVVGVLAVLLLLGGVVVLGNDYRVRKQELQIEIAGQRLQAVLTLPKKGAVRGLVVVVHGDGPVDATHEGLYLPWFEAAADAGYASVSWSKPGVGGSDGDWLEQSMADRATETGAVIDWVRHHGLVPTDRIVLWGASQAGWVLPKVAAARTDITAVVAVSPAINWLRQGRYHLLTELDHDKAGAGAREAAHRRSDQTRALLQQGADYGSYRARTDDPEPMDERRWRFVSRNYTADATEDLRAMAGRELPVLLMLGGHDRNVDIRDTEHTYRQLLAGGVQVEHFNAAHSMARPIVEDSTAAGLLVGTLWPRALLADRVLATYQDFLSGLG